MDKLDINKISKELFYEYLQSLKIENKEEMIKKCDEVIEKICQEQNYNGLRTIAVLQLNNELLNSVTQLFNLKI